MKKNQRTNTPKTGQQTDRSEISERWDELFENIAALAHRRSKSLLAHHDEDDDAFDRGARSLRTLMSSAEVAQRMKQFQAKESETNDEGAEGPGFTTADVESEYRRIKETVERIDREDAGGECAICESGDGNLPPVKTGMGGDVLGGQRS